MPASKRDRPPGMLTVKRCYRVLQQSLWRLVPKTSSASSSPGLGSGREASRLSQSHGSRAQCRAEWSGEHRLVSSFSHSIPSRFGCAVELRWAEARNSAARSISVHTMCARSSHTRIPHPRRWHVLERRVLLQRLPLATAASSCSWVEIGGSLLIRLGHMPFVLDTWTHMK